MPESLLDRFAASFELDVGGLRCKVADAIDMQPDMADEIEELVHAPMRVFPNGQIRYFPAKQVAKMLRSEGIDIPESTVIRHRTGGCICHKTDDSSTG